MGGFDAVILRLRPALIRASRVLPSTPPLSHRVERHFFDGQFGGFSVSGIQRCPQTLGIPIHDVALLLGHSSVRTTEKHYAPFVMERREGLLDAVRLAWKFNPND